VRCPGAGGVTHGYHERQINHLRATILVGHRDAEEAQVAKLSPEVHGELVAGIDFRRARGDLRLSEIAHRVAQHVDVGTQVEIEAGKVHGEVSRVLVLFYDVYVNVNIRVSATSGARISRVG